MGRMQAMTESTEIAPIGTVSSKAQYPSHSLPPFLKAQTALQTRGPGGRGGRGPLRMKCELSRSQCGIHSLLSAPRGIITCKPPAGTGPADPAADADRGGQVDGPASAAQPYHACAGGHGGVGRGGGGHRAGRRAHVAGPLRVGPRHPQAVAGLHAEVQGR